MVTSVTMSGTIMAQRSDFADQRSFRVTASEIYKWRHLIENFFRKLKERPPVITGGLCQAMRPRR